MHWPWKSGRTLFPQSFDVTRPSVGATAVTAMPLGLIFNQVLLELPPNMGGLGRTVKIPEPCRITCVPALPHFATVGAVLCLDCR